MIRVSPVNWKTKAKGQVGMEVLAEDHEGRVTIDVEARWTVTQQDGPRPTVLWKAVGPVSTTVAREFAMAILKAADIADEEATAPEEES